MGIVFHFTSGEKHFKQRSMPIHQLLPPTLQLAWPSGAFSHLKFNPCAKKEKQRYVTRDSGWQEFLIRNLPPRLQPTSQSAPTSPSNTF